MSKEMSRRKFLKTGTMAAIGLSVVPSTVLGKARTGKKAPSDKLNILGVGIGGRGSGVLRGLETENIVGLCDVDWKYAKGTFERYPQAKRFVDWRKMYDDPIFKTADAVMCATADHTHCVVSANAIAAGKHVYCEKPLTLSVYESRLLTKLAAKHQVATQMGNQGASNEGVRLVCDWIWNGEIGEVTRVDAFTDRPIWPQGLEVPTKVETIPDTLDWDCFIGPAKMLPYNSIYTPWNFRGWWDFGTGALGDMACHILHPAFKALKLGYPIWAEGSSTPVLTDSCPSAQMVKLTFPARDNMPKVAMPEVELTWYDGGFLPPRPKGLPEGVNLNVSGGAVIFYGTKDTLICGCYGEKPYLVSGRTPVCPKTQREIPAGDHAHQQDFVRACKESAESRILTASDFSEAGPFNEMVVMGVLAVRLQGLNQKLAWDGENMKFTNIDPKATIKFLVKDGFSITDGHPTFQNVYTDPVNALEFANKLIKPVYRDGWTLPEMPK